MLCGSRWFTDTFCFTESAAHWFVDSCHVLTDSLLHWFIDSQTHAFIDSQIHWLIDLVTSNHWFPDLLIHWFIRCFVYSLIQCSLNYWFFDAFVQPLSLTSQPPFAHSLMHLTTSIRQYVIIGYASQTVSYRPLISCGWFTVFETSAEEFWSRRRSVVHVCRPFWWQRPQNKMRDIDPKSQTYSENITNTSSHTTWWCVPGIVFGLVHVI